jgi:hypothetical protein
MHMASSRKKVIARKLTHDWVSGYLPPSGFLHNGFVELLALDGKLLHIPAADLKWICYVRDFNSGEASNPERLLRKNFAGRPRIEGLLLHIRLSDDDMIEGLAANDLSLVSGEGLYLIPPDTRSNTQRLWIPPTAIAELEVVSVIGAAKHKRPAQLQSPTVQESLFKAEESEVKPGA